MNTSLTTSAKVSLVFVLLIAVDLVQAESPSVTFLNQQIKDPSHHFSDHYLTVNGHQLHYVSAGQGDLIIFYHGFPSYWYMWKNQLLELVKDYRVVAVDGLGANLSAKPSKLTPYRVDSLATQIYQLSQALNGDKKFLLIGHDWGGALAWSYAQQYPKTLNKLVVLNAPPTNLFLELLRSNADQRAASSYIDRLKLVAKKGEISSEYADRMSRFAYANLRQQGHVSDAEAKLYQTALTRPGAIAGGIRWYQANIPTFAEIADEDFWPSPKASTTVTSLLIWGQDDGTFVPAFLEQLPIYAKDLTIEVLPDVGHWPALEAPNEVNELLRNFIQSP